MPEKNNLTPALFIAHGTPMNALEDNLFTQDWLQLATGINPKAILCISAHWYTTGSWVTTQKQPPTIHDFSGFPPALQAMQYPAPGASTLALQLIDQLQQFNLKGSDQWGFDHGTWSVLSKLFPNANIPTLQLSIDMQQPPAWHFALGQALSHLRQEGVLLLGSGNIVHNIPKWLSQTANADPSWAIDFDDAVKHCIYNEQWPELFNYLALSCDAKEAVPTPEHFLPLLYVLGSKHKNESIKTSGFKSDSLAQACMRSYRIG